MADSRATSGSRGKARSWREYRPRVAFVAAAVRAPRAPRADRGLAMPRGTPRPGRHWRVSVPAWSFDRRAWMLALTLWSSLVCVGWPPAAVGRVPLLDAFGQSDTRFTTGDRDLSGFSYNPDGLGDVDGDGADDVTFGFSIDTGVNAPQGSLVVPGRHFRSLEAVSRRDRGAFRVIGGVLGIGLRAAGDVNGDGLGDMIADGDDLRTSYVIFGQRQAVDVKLSRLGDRGFAMTADAAETEGVAGAVPAGDVNGDGRGDLLLTATEDDGSGFATVVFGAASTATVNVAAPGPRGFRIDGLCNGIFDDGDFVNPSGFSAAGPGDVNGDALADVVIGSDRRERLECAAPRRGEAVVVFGKTDTSSVDSRNLGPGGATFTGPRGTGVSVQPAGDFSGDGRPDFSIQTPVGVSVVLGADSLGGGRIQRLGRGETLIRRARGYGAAPAALGDFNGDGLADIGVGNHVVHGVRSKREILLDDLEGGGFRIRQTGSFLQGAAPGQLSFAGDPDGDGRAELFVESESAAGVERAYMLDADGLPKVVVAPFRRVIAAPRGQTLKVRALCPATAAGYCSGRLRLSIASKTLLASRLRIPAGRTVLISRRLDRRQKRLIAGAKHADRRVRAVARARDRRGRLVRSVRIVKLRPRP